MDRLTKRDVYGNADIIGVDSSELQGGLAFNKFNLVTAALNRLAAYEDTGLTPEHAAELAQAEREGRVMLFIPVGEIFDTSRGKVTEAGPVVAIMQYGGDNKGFEVRMPLSVFLMGLANGQVKETREEAEAALEKRKEAIP